MVYNLSEFLTISGSISRIFSNDGGLNAFLAIWHLYISKHIPYLICFRMPSSGVLDNVHISLFFKNRFIGLSSVSPSFERIGSEAALMMKSFKANSSQLQLENRKNPVIALYIRHFVILYFLVEILLESLTWEFRELYQNPGYPEVIFDVILSYAFLYFIK